MSWQDPSEQLSRPFFQRFWQQGVVGVVTHGPSDGPGLVPDHAFFVHQQAHQFGNGDSRVRVVQLQRIVAGQFIQRQATLFVLANNIFQRAGAEEVLLNQAQILALRGGIFRVEYAGDGIAIDQVTTRFQVFTLVVLVQVDRVGTGMALPQAQTVNILTTKRWNGDIPRHADQSFGRSPAVIAIVISVNVAEQTNLYRFRWTTSFPWAAEFTPDVRYFFLLAMFKYLTEQTVTVVNAIASSRNLLIGQRVHKTRRQSSKTAITKRHIALLVQHVGNFYAVGLQQLSGGFIQIEVHQGIAKQAAHKKFHGQIANLAGSFCRVTAQAAVVQLIQVDIS